MRSLLWLLFLAVLPAAEPAALVDLRAANQARSELAREQAAAAAERQRLEALIAATTAETARIDAQAEAGERRNHDTRQRVQTLAAGEAGALRARLDQAGADLLARLRTVAASSLPGTLRVDEAGSFAEAVRALERGERAATQVAVEVVTGQRGGTQQAVRLLRVAGAAAWWVALDGRAAGRARMQAGVLVLEDATGEQIEAIRAALAQAEGRAQPRIELLP